MVALPSQLSTVMFGVPLGTSVELTWARIFGVAVLALGVACWLTRGDEQGHSTRGVTGGMVVFNTGVVMAPSYTGIGGCAWKKKDTLARNLQSVNEHLEI
jgi:hypothetical protein